MYVQLESFFSLKFFQIHLELHFKSFYIDSWLYGKLTLLEVALVCWRMRNKSQTHELDEFGHTCGVFNMIQDT